MRIKVLTSNPGKQAEFRRFFKDQVEFLTLDLPEPDADPITILRFKAAQYAGVLVDDVSLDVEGVDAGPLIRWKLQELENWRGRNARFVCRLAILQSGSVQIFEGFVEGSIVEKRGESFGFNPYFLPRGRSKTLAEDTADDVNARFYAVQNFLEGKLLQSAGPLYTWSGPFQSH